ncbi:hypothetical protein SteCoe_24934 [Stentor coeruleus]|uniref:Serine/threonine-protein kinase PLK n=1 Tax=Stentor coeruleus TaxID=5963 RepID=A0A1R2BGE0_9CILI|nr:hypothetical protein SteCoe_24934 [Stentor coeruleus]
MSSQNNNTSDDLPKVLTEKILKPNGDLSCKHYTKGYFLGKGAFARVYKLTCTETNEMFAGKIISKAALLKSRARQKLMSEIKIHRSLHHNNVVKFFNYFEDDDYLYILMELCSNQSLSDMIRRRKRITELEAQSYLLQVISGMKYLHSHRVIHRDIKLGNIFITENMELKLGDFGLAAKLEYDGERKRTICGTPNYMAPEILDGKFGHSYECDIWSFGVLMYTLIIGRPPFEASDVKMTYRRIKLNLYNFPENVTISSEARSLITSILVTDYAKRPTFDEILKHDFFTRNLIPKLLPSCVLAVPPSNAYVKQFESRGRTRNQERSITRASTHENIVQESTPSPGVHRPHSKDPGKPLYSESRGVPCFSMYTTASSNGPDVWIKSWLDLSHKYGIGYALSNSHIGVLFNDRSKIVSCLGNSMRYFDPGPKGDVSKLINSSDYPQELTKKVKLLQLFKRQLSAKDPETGQEKVAYLKYWVRTPHAVLFRISNKVIQVIFNDKSELLFSNISKYVTFIDRKGVTNSFALSTAIELGNRDLVKRLKYSKEVLIKMIKSGKNTEINT